MTREEIKVFCDMKAQLEPENEDIFKAIIKALEQGPRWIPISERLPEESYNSILGWDAYRERCVFVQYLDGCFQIAGTPESFDIRAWMPLPESYKENTDA